MKTSCSEKDAYPTFCHIASVNQDIFNIFRSDPTYISVVESVAVEDGKEYLSVAFHRSPQLKKVLLNFQLVSFGVLLKIASREVKKVGCILLDNSDRNDYDESIEFINNLG